MASRWPSVPRARRTRRLLTVFDSNLQATGRSTLRLRLTGTPGRPVLNGAMDIQDVSLDYSGLPFRFNNLQGTINLEGERAVIQLPARRLRRRNGQPQRFRDPGGKPPLRSAR